jgi:hypothetical protein
LCSVNASARAVEFDRALWWDKAELVDVKNECPNLRHCFVNSKDAIARGSVNHCFFSCCSGELEGTGEPDLEGAGVEVFVGDPVKVSVQHLDLLRITIGRIRKVETKLCEHSRASDEYLNPELANVKLSDHDSVTCLHCFSPVVSVRLEGTGEPDSVANGLRMACESGQH